MTTETTTLTDEYGDPVECMDDPDTCEGAVGYHAVPGGNAMPRCEAHWELRLTRWEESDLERYADSDLAPSWFDPEACGERWDDDY